MGLFQPRVSMESRRDGAWVWSQECLSSKLVSSEHFSLLVNDSIIGVAFEYKAKVVFVESTFLMFILSVIKNLYLWTPYDKQLQRKRKRFVDKDMRTIIFRTTYASKDCHFRNIHKARRVWCTFKRSRVLLGADKFIVESSGVQTFYDRSVHKNPAEDSVEQLFSGCCTE